MSLWRYTALDPAGGAGAARPRRGELDGDSAHAVRESLRRAGLRVLDVTAAAPPLLGPASPLASALHSHLRSRRKAAKAELLDSLATMLDAGVPLDEALAALARSRRSVSALRMIRAVAQSVRAGEALGAALRAHPSWFDSADAAMADAGVHSGDLPAVLRSLAERHERAADVNSRLAMVLIYPSIVACVGLGVVAFLSTRTLPQLAAVLEQARVPVPGLTLALISFGQFLSHTRLLLLAAAVTTAVLVGALKRSAVRRGLSAPRPPRWLPAALRRSYLARLCSGLADLTRAGIPLVDAMRTTAPTLSGPFSASLRSSLNAAADALERGDDLATSLSSSPLWFDEEFVRLAAVGEAGGEVPTILARLARRYERSARRAVDALAAALEPAVILLLATMIGAVVMAAVLPMIRLQEVVR